MFLSYFTCGTPLVGGSDLTLGGDSVKSDASWQPKTSEQAQMSENIASVKVPAASAALITLHCQQPTA